MPKQNGSVKYAGGRRQNGFAKYVYAAIKRRGRKSS